MHLGVERRARYRGTRQATASPQVMATGVYAGQTLPDSGLPMLLDGAGIAAAAGLRFAPIDRGHGRWRMSRRGSRRCCSGSTASPGPRAVIDRVEPVPTTRRSAGARCDRDSGQQANHSTAYGRRSGRPDRRRGPAADRWRRQRWLCDCKGDRIGVARPHRAGARDRARSQVS